MLVARAALGLTRERAASLAGISASTLAAVEDGKASVQLDTLASACDAVGLRLWVRAYPGQPPSLRDSGQMELASLVCAAANGRWRVAMEHVVDARYGRAADLVLFGPDEILQVEIERRILDWQAQYRAARLKHALLLEIHRRPVRLVVAVEDTRRNRFTLGSYLPGIRLELPAASRDVWRAIRTGRSLARDGLIWLRRPPRRRSIVELSRES